MSLDRSLGETVVSHPQFNPDGAMHNQRFAPNAAVEWALLRGDLTRNRYAPLVKTAKQHAEAYRRPIAAPTTLVVVHPFFATMSPPQRWDERQQRELSTYLANLRSVLEHRDPKKLGVVLWETAQHYLSLTSLHLESGLADDALFTDQNTGMPWAMGDRKRLPGTSFIVAGAYNGKCLDACIGTLYTLYGSRIKAAEGLVLNRPDEGKPLLERESIPMLGPHHSFVSLEQYFKN